MTSTAHLLGHIRRLVVRGEAVALSDGQLLGRFIERRDEAAFAVLVQRHGPMVYGVCRRALAEVDAEDAFQATFLILVRKAAVVRPREMVANWLYGVACHITRKAQALARKRFARERQVEIVPELPARHQETWDDLSQLLDEELHRLPDKYRAPVVLCDLEGMTRKAAAEQLGWGEGTLSWRLATGRKLLAERLTQRGVSLSWGVACLTLLPTQAMSLPPALEETLITSASRLLAHDVAKSVLAPQVALLMKGATNPMALTKATGFFTLLLLSAALLGSWLLPSPPLAAGQSSSTPPSASNTAKPVLDDKSPDKAERFYLGGFQTLRGLHFGETEGSTKFLLSAEGKQVRLQFRLRGADYDALAERILYDEEKQLLFLEADKDDGVRVVIRTANEGNKEITCRKLIIDRKNKRMEALGAGSIRQ